MSVPEALDPEPLLRFLHERGVAHIIIGGVAVAAHGYPRPTKDLDIVPARRDNLTRLAAALKEINACHTEGADFTSAEFPMDPTDPEDLSAGGNFRLDTDLGPLDVMQWIAGIDADDLFAELDRGALAFMLDDIPLRGFVDLHACAP